MERAPPLNAIRAFEAAGRLSSITEAANEISVTPAAISHHIKTLEEHLKVRLFVRSHRSITLTPEGERYLAEISRHLAGIRRATSNMRKQSARSVLTIRAHATFAMRWLVPHLSSFHAAHRDIDLRLTTLPQSGEFDGSAVDAAIRLGTGQWNGFQAERLVRNELSPVCSPQLLNLRPQIALPEGLANETLLHSLARPDDWKYWLKAMKISVVDAYGGLKYESSVLAYQAALEGQGIAMGQKILVAADLAAGRLVCPYEFTLDLGAYTYYFAWPLDAEPSPALKTFKDWLTSELATDREPPRW